MNKLVSRIASPTAASYLRSSHRTLAAATAGTGAKKAKYTFSWSDPLLLHDQLTEEEQLIASTAREYVKANLLPRVISANRLPISNLKDLS
jgi:hypothetical protein